MTLILAASALTWKEDIPQLLSLWSDFGELLVDGLLKLPVATSSASDTVSLPVVFNTHMLAIRSGHYFKESLADNSIPRVRPISGGEGPWQALIGFPAAAGLLRIAAAGTGEEGGAFILEVEPAQMRRSLSGKVNPQFPYLHLGISCFDSKFLKIYPELAATPLQLAEDLEKHKVLQNGYRITGNKKLQKKLLEKSCSIEPTGVRKPMEWSVVVATPPLMILSLLVVYREKDESRGLLSFVGERNFIGSITRLNNSFSTNELPEMYVSAATLPQQRNCVHVQTDVNRELTDYG
ncbi:hypothetical protein QYE76_015552 [Lolium multiflorum]|uniref:Uncharacterized protein n=1 Tax=Lolium multiflorum TaxID=4521 RepID=A0AAD8X7V1_LOLMU|nr:hypothetical protein QYE76_015552 [Lolium multiflorum]